MTVDISYISRKLSWTDKDFNPHSIEDTEILEFHQPVIILGDPGMGKTFLMERLGEQSECKFIRATSFLRQPDQPITSDKRLVIDGLDEVAAVEEGVPASLRGFHAWLPRFSLTSLGPDWRGFFHPINNGSKGQDTIFS